MIKRQEKIFSTNDHLDNIKGQKMMSHWEGPFVVHD